MYNNANNLFWNVRPFMIVFLYDLKSSHSRAIMHVMSRLIIMYLLKMCTLFYKLNLSLHI